MLILKDGQVTIWELILPREIHVLSEELQEIDEILDDPRYFEPYLKSFNTKIGRPTVKVETYIRMMYLKFQYQLGYEN